MSEVVLRESEGREGGERGRGGGGREGGERGRGGREGGEGGERGREGGWEGGRKGGREGGREGGRGEGEIIEIHFLSVPFLDLLAGLDKMWKLVQQL